MKYRVVELYNGNFAVQESREYSGCCFNSETGKLEPMWIRFSTLEVYTDESRAISRAKELQAIHNGKQIKRIITV